MADRVTEPRRVGIGGKRPPVGPDGTPFVFALPELKHAVVQLNDLVRRGHEHDTRKTNRIALQNGKVAFPPGAPLGPYPGFSVSNLAFAHGVIGGISLSGVMLSAPPLP